MNQSVFDKIMNRIKSNRIKNKIRQKKKRTIITGRKPKIFSYNFIIIKTKESADSVIG